MVKMSALDRTKAERLEFEAVLVALERAPKLARLMGYLAERYFAGEAEHLTEYNIATEVFDRKETAFIASEDAVARVETHRLRKKLRAYYDAEGKNHLIQISIPLGKYTPVFTRKEADGEPQNNVVEKPAAEEPEPQFHPAAEESRLLLSALPLSSKTKATPLLQSRIWLFAGVLLATLLCGLSIYRIFWSRWPFVVAKEPTTTTLQQASLRANPNLRSAIVPLHMIAGYSGPPQRDSAGDIWQADQYFRNGSRLQQPNTYIDGTSNSLIFRYGRVGNLDYDIPLDPGSYELHLYFAEITPAPGPEDYVSKRAFNVFLNGKVAIPDLDPISDATGLNIADERIVRDVSPDRDGILHLHLGIVMGVPFLNALEIIPSSHGKQLPLRITTRTTAWTDRNGQVWYPDSYFRGGRRLTHNLSGSTGVDADLYSAERYGHFSYAIPTDPRDRYTVILHFAELFWGNEDQGTGGSGSRIFRVMCNGSTLLDDFDIFREAGPAKPLIKTFYHLKPTAQGKLYLTFEPIKNYATVSAIEVLDEAKD